ncbi:MAG: tetratricopeptide repeat protein [Candidatus Sumerlaeota bacterium]|nr:tetratricopeptide repeat protein [Candidatus Sumerlaeota bacterium]
MSLYSAGDLSTGSTRARAAIHGFVALALLLAFFSTRTPEALPLLRLRETRLAFLLHLVCNGAFLYCVGRRAWAGGPMGFRSAFVLCVGWFAYVSLAAARSPVRGAALEEWSDWLDALLLLYVASTELAEAPEFFLLLLTGTTGLAAVVSLWPLAKGQLPSRGLEIVFALTVTLAGAAALFFTNRERPSSGSLKWVGALALCLAGLGALSWLLGAGNPTAPERLAAEVIAAQHPATGCGAGSVPEMLTAFAPGDAPSLPLPRDSWLVLRGEFGWIGMGFLVFLAAIALLTGLRHLPLLWLESRATIGIGLIGLLALTLVSVRGDSTLCHPFGRLLLFLTMGLLIGVRPPPAHSAKSESAPLLDWNWRAAVRSVEWREVWRPSTWDRVPWLTLLRPLARFHAILGLAALVGIAGLTAEESRPWIAAGLALPRKGEGVGDLSYGLRLGQATRVYPHEASHWEDLAAYRREQLNRLPFDEARFQRAVDAFQRAIEADPFRWKAHLEVALLQFKANRLSDAILALERGLEYRPQSETLRRWLVKAQIQAGQYDEAAEELTLLARDIPPRLPPKKPNEEPLVNPDWIQINFRLAEVYEALGQLSRALDHYAIAYQKDPHGLYNGEALQGLQRLKTKILAGESAKEGAEEEAGAAPGSPSAPSTESVPRRTPVPTRPRIP